MDQQEPEESENLQNRNEVSSLEEVDSDLPSEAIQDITEVISEEVAPEKQERVRSVVMQSMRLVAEQYSGPIPHHSHLKGYESVYPGAAKLIIDNAIEESVHRRKTNTLIITEGYAQQRRGQNYGLIVALSFLALSVLVILLGYPVAGTILGSVDLVALVGVFVIGQFSKKKASTGKRDDDNEE